MIDGMTCGLCGTTKRGRKPIVGSDAWHRERQPDLLTGEIEPYVCPACREAREKGRAVEVVGSDPMTGEPVVWRGFGRKPEFADKTTGKLDRWLRQVEDIFEGLLRDGDTPLGRFQSEEDAKRFAYRLNLMRNRVFNACKAHKAARLRAAGAAVETGEEMTLCTERAGR
jgi:hypothetical protein